MNSISIHFFIRKYRTRQDGKAPIYMRITVNGKRTELSMSRAIEPKRWDSKGNMVKGRKPDAKSINRHLEQMKQKVYKAEHQLNLEDEEITAKSLKARMTGSDKEKKTIKEIFKSHNEKMKSLIDKDFSESTYKKYRTAYRHLKNFMQQEYGNTEVLITKVDHNFLEKLEYYLKTEQDHSHNTAMKYIGNFKKIIQKAIKQGWLDDNPFEQFDHKFEQKDPIFLAQDELDKVENKEFDIDRLDRVRDIFVFSCYTALGFSDAEKLKKSDVRKDKDGEAYLHLSRTKTGKTSKILLLPKALEVIEKYKDDPETRDGKLLPMISNQKTNAYLKEIADLCGIKKKLTHHVARHTCATTVLLANGFPIETVQEVMGHANLSSTQHYARVTQTKVNKEFKALREVISSTG